MRYFYLFLRCAPEVLLVYFGAYDRERFVCTLRVGLFQFGTFWASHAADRNTTTPTLLARYDCHPQRLPAHSCLLRSLQMSAPKGIQMCVHCDSQSPQPVLFLHTQVTMGEQIEFIWTIADTVAGQAPPFPVAFQGHVPGEGGRSFSPSTFSGDDLQGDSHEDCEPTATTRPGAGIGF